MQSSRVKLIRVPMDREDRLLALARCCRTASCGCRTMLEAELTTIVRPRCSSTTGFCSSLWRVRSMLRRGSGGVRWSCACRRDECACVLASLRWHAAWCSAGRIAGRVALRRVGDRVPTFREACNNACNWFRIRGGLLGRRSERELDGRCAVGLCWGCRALTRGCRCLAAFVLGFAWCEGECDRRRLDWRGVHW